MKDKEQEPELNNAGYFLDELHDFDEGYKIKRRSRITPFFGENR